MPEKEETSAPDESEQPASESTAEGLAGRKHHHRNHAYRSARAAGGKASPKKRRRALWPDYFLFSGQTERRRTKLSEDNQWLVGMDTTMEYITANTYEEQDASAANNPYWTKIAGGTRPDGTQY